MLEEAKVQATFNDIEEVIDKSDNRLLSIQNLCDLQA
jgi:hypothetical protein